MTEFFVFAALLVVASLVFVLLPLWRAGAPAPDRRREANITIYHQRYAEIEREVAAGRLERREAEAQKDELGARLLVDIDAAPALAGQPHTRRRPWIATVLVAVLMIGGAGGTYWALGDRQSFTADRMPDMATMIAQLEQRVAEQPDDLQARTLLAQAQKATGDYAAAASNLRAVNAVMRQPQARLLAAEAQATLQATDDLQGRAGDLYARVLEIEPDNAEALWFLGLGASERGDSTRAIEYWERLLQQDLPEEFRTMVANRRNELTGDKPRLDGG